MVQVGLGETALAARFRFLPLQSSLAQWEPVREEGRGAVDLVWVCVLRSVHAFCVCFCCELQPDVSGWAPPNQLQVVIRCCQTALCLSFYSSLCPLGPLFLCCRNGSHPGLPWCPEAALLCFLHKYVLNS